jgi:acetate kinase
LPEESTQYALPRSLVEKYGYRKYGFHGLSYHYITSQIPSLLGRVIEEMKLIICHLGTGGSSLAAVNHGAPLDTSMGYSPLPGLVMSTRCGDIDAEIVLDLVRRGYAPDEISTILNNQSGLIGLSGFSSNLAEIIEEAERGNTECQLAYDVYVHRLKSYIGAYTSLLNGADVLVFTDDIGMKSWKLREKVLSNSDHMGFELDIIKNRNAPIDSPVMISTHTSQTQVWIIPTDEESVILQEVMAQM